MTTDKTLEQILEEFKLNTYFYPNNLNFGTDKGTSHSYVKGFYEENFKKYRSKDITLVEIGVRSGASLCLWRNYFSEDSIIIGMDDLSDNTENNIPVNDEWVSGKNVEYIIGNAYDESALKKLPEKIDILIDDGPHSFESHVKLLELYTSKMNEGGIIVIEDVRYPHDDLFKYVDEKYQDNALVYDFGGWDDKLIIINT
jgi:predicted O-methyltransferase YrrM